MMCLAPDTFCTLLQRKLVTPYCVFAELVSETVFDQTVVCWKYSTEPGVLEGQFLRIPIFWL